MDQVLAQLNAFVHDKKHFSARHLAQLAEVSGTPPDVIAKGVAVSVALFLAFSTYAHLLANSLLVLLALIVTHVYRDERPNRDNLLVFWGCFGLMTLFDRFFETLPLYYLLKIALLALLFLRPFRFVTTIKAKLFPLRKTFNPSNESGEDSSTGMQ